MPSFWYICCKGLDFASHTDVINFCKATCITRRSSLQSRSVSDSGRHDLSFRSNKMIIFVRYLTERLVTRRSFLFGPRSQCQERARTAVSSRSRQQVAFLFINNRHGSETESTHSQLEQYRAERSSNKSKFNIDPIDRRSGSSSWSLDILPRPFFRPHLHHLHLQGDTDSRASDNQ